MGSIDLHLHTNASDGRFTPAQLVDIAYDRGLKIIAVTDHDTVDGIEPALEQAEKYPALALIPGIEMSTYAPGCEVHLLGYFIDYTHPKLVSFCTRMRSDRIDRARAMVSKLKGLGVDIEWEHVERIAGESNIGRPHIAMALLERRCISVFEEAFELYLGYGKPAYVERFKITPQEAAKLITECGGLPVLAHPMTVDNYPAVIADLCAAGLEGLEIYYKDFTREERQNLLRIAEKMNLVATGGSDYHGIDDTAEVLPGDAGVPENVGEKLLARARAKGAKIPGSLERYSC
ncbi:MAG: PHP domain-containing protein [Dehalococcoidaceae bacterium]|nr:PHP domain-containing protein [Dehalococcoidaceae bacterium]